MWWLVTRWRKQRPRTLTPDLAVLVGVVAVAFLAMHGAIATTPAVGHPTMSTAVSTDFAGVEHDHRATAPCHHQAGGGGHALSCTPALVGASGDRVLLLLVALAALWWLRHVEPTQLQQLLVRAVDVCRKRAAPPSLLCVLRV